MLDSFTVGNTTFSSRLLVGTGKYASYNLMRDALVASKSCPYWCMITRNCGNLSCKAMPQV